MWKANPGKWSKLFVSILNIFIIFIYKGILKKSAAMFGAFIHSFIHSFIIREKKYWGSLWHHMRGHTFACINSSPCVQWLKFPNSCTAIAEQKVWWPVRNPLKWQQPISLFSAPSLLLCSALYLFFHIILSPPLCRRAVVIDWCMLVWIVT